MSAGAVATAAPPSSACNCDICIVGAGTIGTIIARDAASCGYSSVVLEKESVIGGVWAKNDYPGLRLQLTGASYRCLSLAPAWMHDGEGKDDVLYRATGKEVLSYIHDMADHALIEVRTSTAYLNHTGSGGNFTVSSNRGPPFLARAIVFAPGVCFVFRSVGEKASRWTAFLFLCDLMKAMR